MAAVTRSASASPSVALNLAVDPSLFPLKSISDVINFFRRAVETPGTEPDLTLLSIVAGYIELSLTTGEAAQGAASSNCLPAAQNADVIMGNSVPFPVVTHDFISGLYKKFQTILAVVEKPKSAHNRQATREVIKKVSDVIWHSLIRSSHKDRAHLQNLYSYLSGNKLDCFGVALAVVAGCQLLGYRDVHLAISEDHAWVVFGNKRLETIEVTWHGKGTEDKRGQDITPGIESGSWLYLGGLAVVCDRAMEVAAIVSAINISLTTNSDCVEVAELQQKLLWLLYDMGHLRRYPMALGTLGELEEISPSQNGMTCEQLYRESIQSARAHYSNHHVYPHTYLGNYFNRLLKYREAFASWANAADVIRLYTYNCRDDEEIYKELLDIANDLIPYVMKTEGSGHSARSILRDSEVFANLLRFYDGICQWEEYSLTPILHIGWAKPLVNNITKFDYDIRSQVVIKVPEDEEAASNEGKGTEAVAGGNATEKQEVNEAKKETNNAQTTMQVEGNNNNLVKNDEKYQHDAKKTDMSTTLADLTAACGEKILNPDFLLQGGGQPFAEQKQQEKQDHPMHNNNNTNNINNNNKEANNGTETTKLEQKQIPEEKMKNESNECKVTKIESVTKTEHDQVEKINATNTITSITTTAITATTQTTAAAATITTAATTSSSSAATMPQVSVYTTTSTMTTTKLDEILPKEEDPFEFMLKRPVITLYSQKMKGLKDLLLAEKLNTHAISLQVTAQSVASKKVRGIDKMGNHTTNSTYATANVSTATVHHNVPDTTADSIAVSRPKRTRRE